MSDAGSMSDKNTHHQPAAATRAISVLSLAVSVLALSVSAVALFSGSDRQDRFEADRQYCILKLDDLSRNLTAVTQNADQLSDAERMSVEPSSDSAELACVDSGILDKASPAYLAWQDNEQALAFLMESDTDPNSTKLTATKMATAVADATAGALNAASPSIFPWIPHTPVLVGTDAN